MVFIMVFINVVSKERVIMGNFVESSSSPLEL
eukprot:CAMPEP_0198153144 /NCGR_PEP_ID=MMETSP1443-20131203/62849_1 /TAXON_ID=186043 /ORGANISM="Entomoneis sp., Strain CCMP2396" /LENGTH=31 /DNA_ID= /DNA_START= /DNA_END= /DNA_ORIENTATION=